MDDNRWFPLQTDRQSAPGPMRIPWSVAEVAYGAYARRYGTDQSLQRLAERGGFSWGEMDELHPKWREDVSEIARLRRGLACVERSAGEGFGAGVLRRIARDVLAGGEVAEQDAAAYDGTEEPHGK